MKRQQIQLLIEQLDRKFARLKPAGESQVPPAGWIHSIRTAMGMSLRQFGQRLGISAQSAKEIEQREVEGSITLKSLREAANAIEMEVVYFLVPKNESLEKTIHDRAIQLATEIVTRTSHSMLLEDQENSKARIEKAIRDMAMEIINSMPKYLWD